MNSTALNVDGMPLTRLHEINFFRCDHCGGEGVAGGQLVRGGLDVTLADLEPSSSPAFGTCPDCGDEHPLALRTQVVAYVPDEQDLPALCHEVRADGSDAWTLVAIARELITTPAELVAELARARADETRVVPLSEVSESELVRVWGRPLSLRAYWRLLVTSSQTDLQLVDASAPGLALAVGAPATEIDRDAFTAQIGDWLAPGTDGGGMVLPARDASWGQALGEELASRAALGLAKLPHVRVELDRALATISDEGVVKECNAPEGEAAADALWLLAGELRASISIHAVARHALDEGLTIAQAASRAVYRRVWELLVANQALTVVRELWGDRGTFEPRAIDDVGLGGGFINLESVLDKLGWTPDPARLREQLTRLVAAADGTEDGRLPGCACGAGRPFLHLRSAEETDILDVVEEIEDLRGERFALVSTIDCDHMISYVPRDLIATHFGGDVENAFEMGVRRGQVRADARLLRDLDGDPRVAVLAGDSIASWLAQERLGRTLANNVAPQLRAWKLFAVAPTTNIVLLVSADLPAEDRESWLEIAFHDVTARASGNPLGYGLGFTAEIRGGDKGVGKIDIAWEHARPRAKARG